MGSPVNHGEFQSERTTDKSDDDDDDDDEEKKTILFWWNSRYKSKTSLYGMIDRVNDLYYE
jgi:hypothetical protein